MNVGDFNARIAGAAPLSATNVSNATTAATTAQSPGQAAQVSASNLPSTTVQTTSTKKAADLNALQVTFMQTKDFLTRLPKEKTAENGTFEKLNLMHERLEDLNAKIAAYESQIGKNSPSGEQTVLQEHVNTLRDQRLTLLSKYAEYKEQKMKGHNENKSWLGNLIDKIFSRNSKKKEQAYTDFTKTYRELSENDDTFTQQHKTNADKGSANVSTELHLLGSPEKEVSAHAQSLLGNLSEDPNFSVQAKQAKDKLKEAHEELNQLKEKGIITSEEYDQHLSTINNSIRELQQKFTNYKKAWFDSAEKRELTLALRDFELGADATSLIRKGLGEKKASLDAREKNLKELGTSLKNQNTQLAQYQKGSEPYRSALTKYREGYAAYTKEKAAIQQEKETLSTRERQLSDVETEKRSKMLEMAASVGESMKVPEPTKPATPITKASLKQEREALKKEHAELPRRPVENSTPEYIADYNYRVAQYKKHLDQHRKNVAKFEDADPQLSIPKKRSRLSTLKKLLDTERPSLKKAEDDLNEYVRTHEQQFLEGSITEEYQNAIEQFESKKKAFEEKEKLFNKQKEELNQLEKNEQKKMMNSIEHILDM